MSSFVNEMTTSLRPYPMEELNAQRRKIEAEGREAFDFGTGDPLIPTWPPIVDAIKNAIPKISQYPSVRGVDALQSAQVGYLKRRFGLSPSADWMCFPSQGSKEAIFHITLSLVSRAGGRKTIIYPNPGYPVYLSATVFAQGTPYPMELKPDNGYLMEPWTLPEHVQNDTAALWVNYPHNPTGAIAPRDYWIRLIEWAHSRDVVILADDCYIDIFDPKLEGNPPSSPIELSQDRVITFLSLSKRSGMTGYRCGILAGDSRILKPHLLARANFGVAMPVFTQAGATVAWNDDEHVAQRRRIFQSRLELAAPLFLEHKLIDQVPQATFYLWARIPKNFVGDDVSFCKELGTRGLIVSPSSWLSEGVGGYFRLAMVPDESVTIRALKILENFLKQI